MRVWPFLVVGFFLFTITPNVEAQRGPAPPAFWEEKEMRIDFQQPLTVVSYEAMAVLKFKFTGLVPVACPGWFFDRFEELDHEGLAFQAIMKKDKRIMAPCTMDPDGKNVRPVEYEGELELGEAQEFILNGHKVFLISGVTGEWVLEVMPPGPRVKIGN